jgi:hypothetical protein
MTWAGADGPWLKYRAPPARPEPQPYPPDVLPSVPPVRFGRSVEANGARPLCEFTMVPMRDLGKEDLSNLTPEERDADVVNRRTAAEMELWVVYHLPLLCLRRAIRWIGWVGALRASIGCSCACVGREPAGSWFCMSFAACRQAALLESVMGR